MSSASKKASRRVRAGGWTRLAFCSLLAGLATAPSPAHAVDTLVPRVSGLPWASGVNGSSAENAAYAAWRGNRKLDVRTIFHGRNTWTHLIASGSALSYSVTGGPGATGRLVVALAMLPVSHAGQLEQCAAGQFDTQIRSVVGAMLRNGAQTAADSGKPVIVRLGWEANLTTGGHPWRATGDGTSWRNCFRRWVNILNPVTDASTTPPTRQKNFLVVWNMANRGDFTYPIENLWPGDEYVDIVGSQFYDRCPPLPEGDRYEFAKRLDARNHHNNPAGPRAWLEFAKAKGKPYAMPEWGIGGPRDVCDAPGVDNPYFIQKMYEFFWQNAADLAFEAYFNASGGTDPALGTHALFAPAPANPAPTDPGYLDYVQRYNPRAAAAYRTLWAAGLEPPPPPPPPPPPEPPPPPPASDTLYWLRYVASYPDLMDSVGPNAAEAYASWVATGRAQKRTAYFDPQGYMDRQPAIRTHVNGDPIAATKHYISLGYDKGYTYSNGPLYWLRYIASHVELIPQLGDLASAGEAHFQSTGRWEGRSVTFDPIAYLQANAEAKALCGSNQTCATKHFINSRR